MNNETVLTLEPQSLTDAAFVKDIRRQMLKFATLQLGDGQLAEDAVQEALLGALKNKQSFGGKAALKTWIFAILKHKIADALRHKQRVMETSNLLREQEEPEDLTPLFDHKGYWRPEARPRDWGDPEISFQQAEFWRVFEACLDALPPQQARVFMMREFIGLETGEICTAADLSTNNLFVLLHRARLRLGKCLEHNWFTREEQSC